MVEARKPRWGLRIAGGIGVLLLALIAYVGIVIIGSRGQVPEASLVVPAPKTDLADALPATITLTTWNLGFAGLGAEGDAISDGGKSFIPVSGEWVGRNLDGIVATLGQLKQDGLLLQEVSQHSLMSWWQPVYDRVVATRPGWQAAFRPDVMSWGLPFPLAVDHGTVALLDANPASVEIVPLPLEPDYIAGFIKRRYSLQVVRVPLAGSTTQWVIVNLHLSAYDADGVTRKAQFDALMALATAEYAKGNHVVLGGDWNMALADPQLPSTTPQSLLGWVVQFPHDKLPEGWSIVTAPEGQATVRTTDQPYVKGENFETAIDGFVISPNVSASDISRLDTEYAFSDHMPVTANFTAN